jgi:hypothetical protein
VERGREEEWKAKTGASRRAGQSVPVVAVFMAGTGLPEFFKDTRGQGRASQRACSAPRLLHGKSRMRAPSTGKGETECEKSKGGRCRPELRMRTT